MNRKIAYQNLLQIDNLSYLMFQNSTLKRNDENLFVLYIGEKKISTHPLVAIFCPIKI